MVKQFTLFILLFSVWYVLSGYDTAFFLGLGAASALFSLGVYHYLYKEQQVLSFTITSLMRMPMYVLWLTKEIFGSSLSVSFQIWRAKPAIDPAMTWVKMDMDGDVAVAVTTYANSITLTPGTVAVKVEKGKILVHALQSSSINELKEGGMERKVLRTIEGGNR